MRKRLKIMKDSVKSSRRVVLTIAVATILLVAGAVTVISRQTARAKEEASARERKLPVTKAANKDAANKTYVTVKVGGQDVQVDSQTGQIKPLSPEEAQKLAAGLNREINQSTDGLVQEHHPDGSVSMDLDGHFQDVVVARTNDDGTLSTSCVNNRQAAAAFFGIDPQLIENPSDKSKAGTQRAPLSPAKNENQ